MSGSSTADDATVPLRLSRTGTDDVGKYLLPERPGPMISTTPPCPFIMEVSCPYGSRDGSLPWWAHQPWGRRKPRSHSPLDRLTVRPARPEICALFLRDFSGALLRPPIRSKARSLRMAVAPRSGTRSRTRPGKIRNDENGDVADDHYRRYREDVQSMKALAVQVPIGSRFRGRAFSRMAPAQRTQRGSTFMTDSSTSSSPMASRPSQRFTTGTYHKRCKIAADGKTVTPPRHSRSYAGYVAEKFSDRARHFFTLNECWTFVELGHATGVFAPGLKLPPGRLNQLRHHVLLAHGLAVQAIRARSRAGTQIGPAENVNVCVPVVETPEHIAAAELATREVNAPYLTAMMEGRYREFFLAAAGVDAPKVAAGDMSVISYSGRFRRSERLSAG